MKLPVPFIQLPLRFDAQRLADEIATVDEADWRPHPQGYPGNSMLPLVAVHGDPANEAFAGPMSATPALRRCPYLKQVFASLGATIGRSRLMRLSGQAEVTRHVDQGYYWTERVRVHVPILTQPTVRFECGDQAINMAAGECWIFDTWREHRVLNDDDRERIHLVIDTVGGTRFWDLVGAGRTPDTAPAGWHAALVEQRDGDVDLGFEAINVPRVMSPWEMGAHFAMLFRESRPHPALPMLQARVTALLHAWQGAWFRYGPDVEDRAPFQALLQAFANDVRPAGQEVVLVNDLRWMSAVTTIVLRFAAGAHESAQGRPAA